VELRLYGNAFTSVAALNFSGLSALQTLALDSNRLTALPTGGFSALTARPDLER
jgi:hypothetical protein